MIHRADIQNNTTLTVDDWGNPVPAAWASLSTLPCRAYTRVRKEVVDGNKTVLVEDLRALFPLKASISEDYRIANIKDRQGAVLFAGPLDISVLQRRGNHIEASLDKVQS